MLTVKCNGVDFFLIIREMDSEGSIRNMDTLREEEEAIVNVISAVLTYRQHCL